MLFPLVPDGPLRSVDEIHRDGTCWHGDVTDVVRSRRLVTAA